MDVAVVTALRDILAELRFGSEGAPTVGRMTLDILDGIQHELHTLNRLLAGAYISVYGMEPVSERTEATDFAKEVLGLKPPEK